MSATERVGPRTVVSYPGVMPAATEVARAFAEAGLLARYETTAAFLPEAAIDRALALGVQAALGDAVALGLGDGHPALTHPASSDFARRDHPSGCDVIAPQQPFAISANAIATLHGVTARVAPAP